MSDVLFDLKNPDPPLFYTEHGNFLENLLKSEHIHHQNPYLQKMFTTLEFRCNPFVRKLKG